MLSTKQSKKTALVLSMPATQECSIMRHLKAKCIEPVSEIETTFYQSINDIPAHVWNEMTAAHFYLSSEFLSAIEHAADEGLQCRYVVICRHGRPVVAAYCQIVKFDLRRTLPANQTDENTKQTPLQWIKNKLRILVSSRKVNVLVAGNAFLSGDYSLAYSNKINRSEAIDLLAQALEIFCQKDCNINAVVIKDFDADNDVETDILNKYKYNRFQIDPIVKMAIKEQWETISDYEMALSTKYRQRYKSAYAKSAPISMRELNLEEIENQNTTLYNLLCGVMKNADFCFKEVPPSYLVHMKRNLKNRFKVMAYYLEDQLVGFLSLIETKQHFEAHYVGFLPNVNQEYKLYQRMLYDYVALAIKYRGETLSFGRTAVEIKTTIGGVPEQANVFVKATNPIMNTVVKKIVEQMPAPVYEQRHPFKVV